MGVETKDIDRGFNALIKELKKLDKNPYVKVGYTKPETHKDSDSSLLLIASSNEFGTSDGKIPERSFMRTTADENRKKVIEIIDKGYDQIINQKTSVERVLNKIGLFIQGKTQKKIAEIDSPPNKEATIKKKGSSNPLVDTGFMRQSVKYEVNMKGGK